MTIETRVYKFSHLHTETCAFSLRGGLGKPDHSCPGCQKMSRNNQNKARRFRDQARRDCGLVKVRGALGGVYWE